MVTKDIDIAGDLRLETPVDAVPLAQRMTEAGFEEERLAPTASSPVIKYVPKDGEKTFDVEFLCPKQGARRRRGAAEEGSVEIHDGLLAQPLQYLEILLIDPWQIDLADAGLDTEIPEKGLFVRIPNPAAYIVQKVLIRNRPREAAAKQKDCYYIYTIAVTFREAIDVLQKCFQAVSTKIHSRWVKRFQREFGELFADAHARGPDAAMMVHEGSSDHVREAAEQGFIVNRDTVYRAVQRLFPAFGLP